MTKFTIEITDPTHLCGITCAREARNASLTPQKDGDGNDIPIEKHDDYIATDEAYVQFVMASAAESYAKSHGLSDDAIAALETKLAAAKAVRGKL